MPSTIPPATLRVLRALDAQSWKRLSRSDLCRDARIKHRGLGPVLSRMERNSFIAFDHEGKVELTFGGLRALRAEPVSA